MRTIETIATPLERHSAAQMRAWRIRGALALLTVVVERVETFASKRRTRSALLELSDSQLKDIGLSRSEAYREAVRPFWR